MHFAVRLDFFFFRAYNLLQWKIPNLSFVDWPWYFKNFERLAKKYLKGINFNFVKTLFHVFICASHGRIGDQIDIGLQSG